MEGLFKVASALILIAVILKVGAMILMAILSFVIVLLG